MNVYRLEIHGHLIEARYSDFGSRQVLVNGRRIERGLLDGMLGRAFHFDIVDERGGTRHVEVLWVSPARALGLTPRVRFSVDGVERATLEAERTSRGAGRCANCGYALDGLRPENGEFKCPECGRHTSVKVAGGA